LSYIDTALPILFWVVSSFKRQPFHRGEPRAKEAVAPLS
jgi:hypothetical protein